MKDGYIMVGNCSVVSDVLEMVEAKLVVLPFLTSESAPWGHEYVFVLT